MGYQSATKQLGSFVSLFPMARLSPLEARKALAQEILMMLEKESLVVSRGYDQIDGHVRSIFGPECAVLIEQLYDQDRPRMVVPILKADEKVKEYNTYRLSLPSRDTRPRKRLMAIFEDIVRNNGVLKFGNVEL